MKRQQSLWRAGFTGVSTACIVSVLATISAPVDPPSAQNPHAQTPYAQTPHTLLAANADHDRMVTLNEVRDMLDTHFARLDTDRDGLIDRDEYAGRHLVLFTSMDTDSNQTLTPAEVRQHNLNGHNLNGHNLSGHHQTNRLFHQTAYRKQP